MSFYTERAIVLGTADIENFLTRMQNEKKLLCELDAELLVNFLIGYASIKLGTLIASIQIVFYKIFCMFGIQSSEILLKSIATRNLFFPYASAYEIGEEVGEYGLRALGVDESSV